MSGTTFSELGINKSDDTTTPTVDIPAYSGAMEEKDLSLTVPNSRNPEGRTPEEQAVFEAAYKAAYAASHGGANQDVALEAARSAVYETN